MARLPIPGDDADQWGALLNEFLRVAHHEDGTLRGICAVINVHDFGATGDGTTDDAAALQAAFEAVPPAGAVVCAPPGIYMVSRPLALRSKTHLKGAGVATVFKRTDSGGGTLSSTWGRARYVLMYGNTNKENEYGAYPHLIYLCQ